jgi:hypothetical protein
VHRGKASRDDRFSFVLLVPFAILVDELKQNSRRHSEQAVCLRGEEHSLFHGIPLPSRRQNKDPVGTLVKKERSSVEIKCDRGNNKGQLRGKELNKAELGAGET